MNLTLYAQKLRNGATKEERHLWYDYLCKLPVRFRRQKPFGRYILDFYCADARLAVELDGSQHYEEDGMARDAERTAFLNQRGIEVVRFSNAEVSRNFPGVCAAIEELLKERGGRG
ncbi:MAG: endonuclease domain-containing protein [Oscillospiraceae bacterium]